MVQSRIDRQHKKSESNQKGQELLETPKQNMIIEIIKSLEQRKAILQYRIVRPHLTELCVSTI